MAVTTRNYSISQATPAGVINALETAISDLGWHEPSVNGYLLTFTNSPGSTISTEQNKRYLVTANATTASAGNGAVFDVLRTQTGAISAVTLVTGGSEYYTRGLINVASTGANLTVADTTGINAGMVVTKIAGTGTLAAGNTVVVSVTNTTSLVIDQTPSVALSGATVLFADTLTLAANSIGGNTYTIACTGTSGQSNVVVSNVQPILVGQRVTGSNVGSIVTVTAIAGNTVTLSKNNLGTIGHNLTFSDEITIITSSVGNANNLTGFASGTTIANVASNTNIYPGAKVTVTAGTPAYLVNEEVFISTITGTGPYTITLRNIPNTFRGFSASGNITFAAQCGNTSTWFARDTYTNPLSAAWAVAKIKNSTDKLGSTFWLFYAAPTAANHQPLGGVATTLYVRAISGFNSYTNATQGVATYDYFSSTAPNQTAVYSIATPVSSTTLVPLTLRTRQSAVDTNFATFSFIENGNLNRNPFFISKYNNSFQPWSLNDVFLGGVYEVFPNFAYSTTDASIAFRTRMTGIPKRMAESGYGSYYQTNATQINYTTTAYRTSTGSRNAATPALTFGDLNFYVRQAGDVQTDVNTQAIFKNIPINPAFAPVPYYLPEDFILAELPFSNIDVGDTLTVSGGEVYTVIQYAINTTSYTGIVLAVRTT